MRKKIVAVAFFMVSTGCNAYAASTTSQLQSSAGVISSSVTSSVFSEQSKQNTKLMLQLKIDALRARLGGISDIEVKMQLEKELKQLQQQRQSI